MSFLDGINTEELKRNLTKEKKIEESPELKTFYKRTGALKEKELAMKNSQISYVELVETNIKASERLRAEINKDITNNKPLSEVLDKSLKVISLMTGDNVFYEMNVKKIRELKG